MARGWLEIPDWLSFENQGGNVALGHLSGDGGRDVVILLVDDGPDQNRGFLRVGRDLDEKGAVTALAGRLQRVEPDDQHGGRSRNNDLYVRRE